MRVKPTFFDTDNLSRDKRLCFVLMPFTTSYSDHIFKTIKDLCKKTCGITALRADELSSADVVIDSIWDHVVKARFIVADLTGRNANVFYELGLAHALGKYVILLTQEAPPPFDIAGIRYLAYDWTPTGIPELEARLEEFLKQAWAATEGDSYYPKTDGEADQEWIERMRKMKDAHLTEIQSQQQQRIDHLSQIRDLQERLTKTEKAVARRDGTSVPAEVLESIHRLEYSTDVETRIDALSSLTNQKNRFAVPNIIDALHREMIPRVRLHALESLSKLGEAHHFGDIQQIHDKTDDDAFRHACLQAMFKLDAKRLVRDIRARLVSDTQIAELILPLMHSSDLDWPSERSTLEALLDSKSLSIRWAALKVLTKTSSMLSSYSANLDEILITRPDQSLTELVDLSIADYKLARQQS